MPRPKTPAYIVDLARRLRQQQTPHEDLLWACLRDRQLGGAKFRRQHPLGRYVLDFYCHEARLAVELEGGVHNQEHQRAYDTVRREGIEQLGIRLLVLKNEELVQDVESTLARIVEALVPHLSPGPPNLPCKSPSPRGRGPG